MKRLGLLLLTFCVIMLMCFVLIKLLPIVVTREQGVDANLIYFKLQERGYITNFVYEGNLIVGYDRVPIMKQLWNYLYNIFAHEIGRASCRERV